MEFDQALAQVIEELMNKYKEVTYKGYEAVKMTSNTTTSEYGHNARTIDARSVKVRHIKNRFKEIDGEIMAIKAVFDVRYPKKRKHNRHEEYFEIT